MGYKYFDLHEPAAVKLRVRGTGEMKVKVTLDRKTIIGEATAVLKGDWQEILVPISGAEGVHSVYFTFDADRAQFESFEFVR